MQFAYLEVGECELGDQADAGHELAKRICQSLDGNGPNARGDYGWEWTFAGSNYRALAVIQKYEDGWLIPVSVGFFDRLLGRGASVLQELCEGIEMAMGSSIKKLVKFKSEQGFRESNI